MASVKNARVLVVDDETDVLFALKMLLKSEVKQVVTEKNPDNLPGLLEREKFDAIFLDMNFKSALNTGNEGIFWLRQILEKDREATVILITAYGDVELAVRSLKEGAADFIVKPWHNDKLLETLHYALEARKPKKAGAANTSPKKNTSTTILGESDAIKEVLYKIEKIAPTEANVLILGENGTGKELVARALHEKSFRANKPFVSVDMGALTDSLFESELFGSKKGAFTDAREDRAGRFEAANGGTLFLDEIGNITPPMQAKLLTVLQNRQVTPLGSNTPVPVDIRLISATNEPIYELAARNQFRKDLIYRINTVEITLPPLRQRTGDVELLARHFAALYAQKNHKPVPEFAEATMQKLKQHSWPGNVRELQHAVERAIILAESNTLQPQDFSFSAMELGPPAATTAYASASEKPVPLIELERETIVRTLEKNKGNISRTAKELGLTRTALYRRLNKHDI
ncbi:sigma-54-dependent transcriptional regulator [Pontibacter akesuensis]|uniref:DNA-binding transcriptional response regulator, NtrC family, contains REC, AAA-type ATPase, and a Fis-type DNA-binding domains n=1 Tax=Pontibacter akesuensis TaxID=388950 RepID=A0A1I7K752_9BACT|nr:sigma-54 dependent transcriptional regulator [Pontibacter akesuensis]GHA74575.1 sigma-54-dependent Fis family transcriptional regulator [Pontibacter akesuensis]SFU93265.1 DNA-binding transcriptional response regulator, NtrC family, contains REC, AAA-type ATPase, and a Fis-type DNA-binding domains [Pontibacter akesuensis]